MRTFLNGGYSSAILLLFFVSSCRTSDSTGKAPSGAAYEIHVEPRGALPRIEAVVTTYPSVKPEQIVTPLAQSMSKALERCSSSISSAALPMGPLTFDFVFSDGKLHLSEAAPRTDPLYSCLQHAIDGTALPIIELTSPRIAVGITLNLHPTKIKSSTASSSASP